MRPPAVTMAETVIRPAVFEAHPAIFAGFTTRHFAGPSRAEAEAAAARLAEAEGFFGTACTEQVHGADVAVVDDPGSVPGRDGLVTRRRGLLIATVAADCALVLLADPEAGVVGACHAGWRGAVAGIVPRAIGLMQELGAAPQRLLAYVSPCISVDRFEVGDEVALQFDPQHVHRREDGQRPHVDLKAAIVAQLTLAGVVREHLEVSRECTVSAPDIFYSYRGERGTAGRMLGLIGLRP